MILGTPTTSSETQVKRAYRSLALRNHPDKVGPAGLELMQRINAAYELIMEEKPWDRPDTTTYDDDDEEEEEKEDPAPTRPSGYRSRRTEAPGLGRMHANVNYYVRVEVDVPLKRHHESATYHDSQEVYRLSYRLRGLDEMHTGCYEDCFNLGVLLNLSKRILVSDEGTIDDAREMFDELVFEDLLLAVVLGTKRALLPKNPSIMVDVLFREWVKRGWDSIQKDWTADSVWTNAQAEWKEGRRTG